MLSTASALKLLSFLDSSVITRSSMAFSAPLPSPFSICSDNLSRSRSSTFAGSIFPSVESDGSFSASVIMLISSCLTFSFRSALKVSVKSYSASSLSMNDCVILREFTFIYTISDTSPLALTLATPLTDAMASVTFSR